MVKNQYPNSHHQAMDGEFKKPHPLSTFMPLSANHKKNNNNSQASKSHKMNQKMNIFNNIQLEPGRPGNNNNTTTTTTFKSMLTKQQQQLNSLTSSTKSNKSALSALSSITNNSSSYRSTCGNDGNIVVIEVGVDDVGIDVGTIEDRLLLGTASPSASSPSSLSSSSSPNTSQSNSLSFKNNRDDNNQLTKLTISNNDSDEHTDTNILSSESILLDMYNARSNNNNNNNQLDSSPISFAGSHHQERGIDCPDYFVPEVKQKPCYPPSLLQQCPPTAPVVNDPMAVFTDAKQQTKFESNKNNNKSSKSAKAKKAKNSSNNNADKVIAVAAESKLDTSQSNLLQETSQDSFVADMVSI